MTDLKRLCVFCGSKHGVRPAYREAARAMGEALVAAGIDLVYGGGRVGLMGVVADAVLDAGGEVIGVIPEAMSDREIAHYGLTDLHVVKTMHERKALMYNLSDGFVALPGEGSARWRSCSRSRPGRSWASTPSRPASSTWPASTRRSSPSSTSSSARGS